MVALEQPESVFVGKVTAASDLNRIAEMSVIAVWKGSDLEEQITIWGIPVEGAPVSATDGRFTVGGTYLVIPENTRQPFLASSCSATQRYTPNGIVIPPVYHDAVGATEGRAPLVTQNEPVTSNSAIPGGLRLVLAVAGVTACGLGVVVYRRRSAARLALARAERFDDTP